MMNSCETTELKAELQSPSTSSEPVNSVDERSCTNSCTMNDVNTALTTSSSSMAEPSSDCDSLKTDFDVFCRFAFTPNDSDNPNPNNDSNAVTSSDQPYYFESDHVALKTNADYRHLMRAFVSLQAERTAALHDLDALLDAQQNALRDPLGFVSQLNHGTWTNQLPRRRHVTELPTVAWEHYTGDVECVLESLGGAGQSSRLKHRRDVMTGIHGSSDTGRANISDGSVSRTTSDGSLSKSISDVPIEKCKRRPVTFNQPWSVEEQRHLERLLEKYPPERFEARRFTKIASELPGRTTQQVTSRVQKYFIKLAKAGLPVPGRTPNLAAYGGRWFTGRYHGRHNRHHHFYFPSSTFLTSYAPPVYMDDHDDGDDDDDDDTSTNTNNGQRSLSSVLTHNGVSGQSVSDDIPDCLQDSDDYRQLRTLTALRQSVDLHTPGGSTVLSDNDSQPSTSQSHIDMDYMSTGVSSYLDPNYMPAL